MATAITLLDESKPTAIRAIKALAETGILVETTGKKRDRSFAYGASAKGDRPGPPREGMAPFLRANIAPAYCARALDREAILRIYLRMARPRVETKTAKVVSRLKTEGWRVRHGGSHDVFEHPARPKMRIVVPRHKDLKPGVARQIARLAGWLED